MPLAGALQRDASRLMLHLLLPLLLVRQQVTAPDRPHVDFRAQRSTAPLQLRGRAPLCSAAATCIFAHCMYAPWLVAVAQLHCA